MADRAPLGWTLVQHSAFGYGGDPTFERATEIRAVRTAAEKRAVEQAGGVLYSNWQEADDTALLENYPPGTDGIAPKTNGRFHVQLQVDALAIYIPAAS